MGILRKQLDYNYKKVSLKPTLSNSDTNRVLRQWAMLKYIDLLESGDEVFNIDESAYTNMVHAKCGWIQKSLGNSVSKSLPFNRVALTVAISNKGRLFYAIHRKNNSTDTMVLFFKELVKLFHQADPDFAGKTVFAHDNCAYVANKKFEHWAIKSGKRWFQYGPYSFLHAPAELAFSHCKHGEHT